MSKEFYDYDKDAKAELTKSNNITYWEDMSITGKFRALHDAIAVAKNSGSPEDIRNATQIYDALGFQLYDFYNKMETSLRSGNLRGVQK